MGSFAQRNFTYFQPNLYSFTSQRYVWSDYLLLFCCWNVFCKGVQFPEILPEDETPWLNGNANLQFQVFHLAMEDFNWIFTFPPSFVHVPSLRWSWWACTTRIVQVPARGARAGGNTGWHARAAGGLPIGLGAARERGGSAGRGRGCQQRRNCTGKSEAIQNFSFDRCCSFHSIGLDWFSLQTCVESLTKAQPELKKLIDANLDNDKLLSILFLVYDRVESSLDLYSRVRFNKRLKLV